MIHQALVIIDDAPHTDVKIHFSIHLAKKLKLRLSGLGAIDTMWIHATQLEPLTGTKFVDTNDESIVSTIHKVRASLDEFYDHVHKAKVPVATMYVEGNPIREIFRVSQEFDFVITGPLVGFYNDLDEPTYKNLLEMGRQLARPIYVVSSAIRRTESVVFAYDGSKAASRAMHMYLLMGLAKDKTIHIVSVGADMDQAEELSRQMVRLLNAHKLKPEVRPIVAEKSPAEHILDIAEEVSASEIILGAFGESLWKEMVFGSCAKSLLKLSKIPLFIHQ